MPRAALHHPARVTTCGDYPVTTTRAPTVRCDLCQRNQTDPDADAAVADIADWRKKLVPGGA